MISYKRILLSHDAKTLFGFCLERFEAGVQLPKREDFDDWSVFLRPIMKVNLISHDPRLILTASLKTGYYP